MGKVRPKFLFFNGVQLDKFENQKVYRNNTINVEVSFELYDLMIEATTIKGG